MLYFLMFSYLCAFKIYCSAVRPFLVFLQNVNIMKFVLNHCAKATEDFPFLRSAYLTNSTIFIRI